MIRDSDSKLTNPVNGPFPDFWSVSHEFIPIRFVFDRKLIDYWIGPDELRIDGPIIHG